MNYRTEFNKKHGIVENGQIQLIPLNLDCMSLTDLHVVKYHPAMHKDMQRYASMKRAAIMYRLKGDSQSAMFCERKCDEIYSTLPKQVRW